MSGLCVCITWTTLYIATESRFIVCALQEVHIVMVIKILSTGSHCMCMFLLSADSFDMDKIKFMAAFPFRNLPETQHQVQKPIESISL